MSSHADPCCAPRVEPAVKPSLSMLQENPYEPEPQLDPVRMAKIHSEIGAVRWLLIVQDKVISVVEVFAKVGGAKRSPLLK